ncbi:CocE/NonD family hydrolase [Polyangium jinanense]|uniref:Esterase n=1 Tax=Polyangium jinanense TaxID=2829994 RepID=A0A9X3XGE8_9BACT|nr:CocE/NonD family hydrolase [Polyangium jinanense]MDC3961742.1 esterase [Polyangium jinanense]MDC3988248.1 esterase [Polyangium jinanense]
MKKFTALALGAISGLVCSQSALAAESVTFDDQIVITSADGTEIAANLFTPAATSSNASLPVIIFINSWALEEHEYLAQAFKFAQDGYIVLSYSARGWGQSTAFATVGGPEDIEDLSAIIDWLDVNTQADISNIGLSGISYGAGLSLLGIANEPRIKTAAALSGWGSLSDALYGADTTSLAWGTILIGSGYLLGEISSDIPAYFADLIAGSDVSEAIAWANERSPLTHVDKINARNAPVYISNNFGDELFKPNSSLKFYSLLTGPKRIDINQGIHASAEATGLLGLPNYVWNNVHDWFDFWLKGVDNGITEKPPVAMELQSSNQRVEFEDWPSASVSTKTLYLGPRGLIGDGALRNSPNTSTYTNSIWSGADSIATTGIPILSAALDAHIDLEVSAWLPAASDVNSIVYETSSLSSPIKLRGVSTLDVWVSPSHSKTQLVAYLYDEDALGNGKLISHGVRTLHNAKPGQDVKLSIEFVTAGYDVPAGHRLALVLDTVDPLYQPATLGVEQINIRYGSSKQSVLTLSYDP